MATRASHVARLLVEARQRRLQQGVAAGREQPRHGPDDEIIMRSSYINDDLKI